MSHIASQRPTNIKSFDEIQGYNAIIEYISHFKDQSKGQAALTAGISLDEAKRLGWLKESVN